LAALVLALVPSRLGDIDDSGAEVVQ